MKLVWLSIVILLLVQPVLAVPLDPNVGATYESQMRLAATSSFRQDNANLGDTSDFQKYQYETQLNVNLVDTSNGNYVYEVSDGRIRETITVGFLEDGRILTQSQGELLDRIYTDEYLSPTVLQRRDFTAALSIAEDIDNGVDVAQLVETGNVEALEIIQAGLDATQDDSETNQLLQQAANDISASVMQDTRQNQRIQEATQLADLLLASDSIDTENPNTAGLVAYINEQKEEGNVEVLQLLGVTLDVVQGVQEANRIYNEIVEFVVTQNTFIPSESRITYQDEYDGEDTTFDIFTATDFDQDSRIERVDISYPVEDTSGREYIDRIGRTQLSEDDFTNFYQVNDNRAARNADGTQDTLTDNIRGRPRGENDRTVDLPYTDVFTQDSIDSMDRVFSSLQGGGTVNMDGRLSFNDDGVDIAGRSGDVFGNSREIMNQAVGLVEVDGQLYGAVVNKNAGGFEASTVMFPLQQNEDGTVSINGEPIIQTNGDIYEGYEVRVNSEGQVTSLIPKSIDDEGDLENLEELFDNAEDELDRVTDQAQNARINRAIQQNIERVKREGGDNWKWQAAAETILEVSDWSQGFSGYSSLFMSQGQRNDWAEARDRIFSELYLDRLGTEFWVSQVCQETQLDQPNAGIAIYENQQSGATRVAASVSGEKINMFDYADGTTEFLYKLEVFVTNPLGGYDEEDANDICFDIILKTPDENIVFNNEVICVDPGATFSRAGSTAIVDYSFEDYGEICIDFKENTLSGWGQEFDRLRFIVGSDPLCNTVIEQLTPPSTLPEVEDAGGNEQGGSQATPLFKDL